MKHNEQEAGGTPARMPQLDGLRAVACAMVMFSHFIPRGYYLRDALPWGPMGVQFFFVLSGFLITGILLRRRAEIETAARTAPAILREFHLRRALRIVPLFYVLLGLLVLLDAGLARQALPWYASFTMNIWRGLTGLNFLNHLWAVGVEVQFYLLWPLILLFVPRRLLIPVVLILALTAPAYRAFAWGAGWRLPLINSQIISNFDTLGMGALLALLHHGGARYDTLRLWIGRAGLYCGAAGLLAFAVARGMGMIDPRTRALFFASLAAFMYFGLCDRAARGFGGAMGAVLQSRPLVYIGTISYGLYVLHPSVRDGLAYLHTEWALPYPDSPWLQLIILSLLSLALASLSWRLLERPLIGLKNRD